MSERWEWVEIIEPRTQEHMYANLTTGECVWDPPPGVRIKKTDDNQWWELYDQNTSRYYYYNATSQKTVWHKPKDCDIIPLAKLQTLKQNTEVENEVDGDALKPVARREMSTQTPTTPKRSEYRIITPRTASVRSSSSMTTQTSPQVKKTHHKQHHHRQGSSRGSRSGDERSDLLVNGSVSTNASALNQPRPPRRRGSQPTSSYSSPSVEDFPQIQQHQQPQQQQPQQQQPQQQQQQQQQQPPVPGPSIPRKSLDSPKPRRSRDRDSSRGSMDSAGSHYGLIHGRSASYDSSGPRSMDSSYTRESPILKPPTPDVQYRTIDNSMQHRYYDSGTYSRDSGSQSQSRSSLDSNPKVYTEMSVGTHGYESSHSRSSYDSSPHGLLEPTGQNPEPIYSSADSQSDSTTGRSKRSFPRTNPAFNSARRSRGKDEPLYYDRQEIQELLDNSGIEQEMSDHYQPGRYSSHCSDSDSSRVAHERSDSQASQGSRTIRDLSDSHSVSSQGSNRIVVPVELHYNSSQSVGSGSSSIRAPSPHAPSPHAQEERSRVPSSLYAQPHADSPRVRPVVHVSPEHVQDYPRFPMSSIQPPPDDGHVYQELEETRRGAQLLREAQLREAQVREAQTVPVQMTPQHHAQSPMIHAQSPMIHAQSPMIHAQSPMIHAQSPMINPQSPMLHAQSPMIHAQSPMIHAQSPMSHAQSPMIHAQSMPLTNQPTVEMYQDNLSVQLNDSREDPHRNFSSSLYTHLNWPGYGDDPGEDSDNSSVFSTPSPQPHPLQSPPSLDLHHASLRGSRRKKNDGDQSSAPILEKSLSLQAELAQHRPISMVVASHSEANMMCPATHSLHRGSYRHISVPTTRSSNSLSRSRRPGSDTEIEQYAEKNLNQHKKGLFGKKMSVAYMLSWSKDPIQKPMLRTEQKSVKKESLETFKLIQQYMCDRKTKHTPVEVALYLTNKGWSIADLRDELYIQLCRQTTDNPWEESLLRGWELIGICLAFFPPTQKFHQYLEGYICRHLDPACDTESVPVSHFAAYCHKKLERISKLGPKRGVRKPSSEEVEAARRCIFQPSMFGATLEEVMLLQRVRMPERRLPWIQTTLSEEVLRLGGAQVEGIFRVPGDIDEVNALKIRVDQWMPPSACPDPHIPASLLKLWLRELYEPIIPEDVYDQCIDNYANPEAAIDIVMGLPEINKLVLCYLIRFLQVFAALENAVITKMDVNNLAMVMAPNCLRCESQDPKVIFENTRKEMAFMRTLVQSLDTSFMEGVI